MNTAAVADFVEFLVAEMDATDSTTFVDDLLTAAKAKLQGKGELAFLASGTLNGKAFSRSKELSAQEIALACRRALQLYNDDAGSGPITFLDFSRGGCL